MPARRRRERGSAGGADPLWSKAPLVLLRYPGLFVSIAVGALLLALAASAYPLFISASASELVKARIDDPTYTRWAVGMMYRNGAMPLRGPHRHGDVEPRADALFRSFVAADPYLDPPVASAMGKVLPVSVLGEQEQRETRLFTGERALANLDVLEGSAADGVLVPDLISDALGASPGDRIVVGSPDEGTITLLVGGIYRSLYRGGSSGYWRPWHDELVLYCSNCAPPAQALILPRAEFDEAARATGLDHVSYAWQAPVGRDLTLQEAEDAARITSAISDRISDRSLLNRCFITFFCNRASGPQWGSAMDDVVRDVHGRLVAIEGSARLLRVAGILVALAVVAGAGAFAMAARRVESALLFARGARPRAVGGRASVEAVLPCVAGAAAGLGLAFALVRTIGPDGALAGRATAQAMWSTAAAAVAAVVAIGTVSTVSFLRRSEHHRSRFRVLSRVPWELALIALSLLILQRLRSGGAVVIDQALRTKAPSLLLFAFPIAFLAGFVALIARVVVLVLTWARGKSARWGTSAYLAVHRLAARSRLTLLLIAAAGLCLGLFVQAQTVARSMTVTVDAKAGVYVGSDVEARIDSINATPERFPLPLTRVVRRLLAGDLRPSVPFDLLAIDARTFASTAYWDPAFASEPLQTLVRRLSEPSDEALPVLIASAPNAFPDSITIDARTLPVRVVGRADAFPGMTSLRPLVVVDSAHLTDAFAGAPSPLTGPNASDELWIRGSPAAARAALAELSYVPDLVLTADQVKDIPYIAAVIDTFLVMNGLGLVAALLVFAAMLMYLQTRQRAEIVSYGLSLRMGMRSSQHLLAIATEVGAMLVIAYVVGGVLAIVAARLTIPFLDPIEAIPPEPISVVPVLTVGLAAPVLLLVACAGGWLTERRARTADLGQVMRLAD
ncbi:MAG TPA: ABC transporter permease [Actinomycetota bacterium]|nr:ABC transporter permease [Actinomycetota bacterium]